ncbi:efflux RND transporter permease subunit [Acidicapsa ligni]|uniref:efflux RND transporter permease subunit n=1 Tax=Acidicapsa ligni TaxID=542300 RepID=UPI0021E0B3AC|nr:efflux RND transporter permease subunit [Acidicapsa ligni]
MTGRLAEFVRSNGRALVLVALTFAVAGALMIPSIPVSIFPETNFPRIVILVDNGITPTDVQMLTVTRPIEEAVRFVPGVTTVRSVTGRGSTEINIFFRWDVDILNALHLVQGRIAQIAPTLPPTAHFYVNRLTFSVFPIVGFSITSETRSLSDLWSLAYYDLAPRLYRLPGVADTRIVGGRKPEFHILVDPAKLNALNMPLTKVVDAIRNSNIIEPAGMVQENYHLYLTTVTGMLKSKEQVESVVVDVSKGTPIQIKDIATVVPGEEPVYNIVTANGRPSVLVNVLQQPDGNTVQIARSVNEVLAEAQRSLPPGIHLSTYYDQSQLVSESIDGVTESIVIGLFLAVIVLLLFLKNWRTTIVAAVVIPIAVLIAIVFMKLTGMSFNLMTLGGIAACIGVVIDDAIVIVENISIHLALGNSPWDASKTAIQELTPALIGSTLTPIVVFVPLVFLGGITAVFFRALAMTLVTALAASLVLAIFFTPVLAGIFLRPNRREGVATIEEAEKQEEGRILRFFSEKYERLLEWSLSHTRTIMYIAAGILVLSILLYNGLGSGFLPDMDEGAFVLDYRTPPGTSLQESNRILNHVEQFLRQTPEVESYSRRTGARLALAIAEPNTGDFLIKLKKKRSRSLEEVTSDLREKINHTEPAIQVEFPHILEDLVGDLAWSPQPIEIKIYNQDEAAYKAAAKSIEEWLPKVKGVVDVENQTVTIGPSMNFRVDPQRAGLAGFSVRDIADIESTILDGKLASNIIQGDRLVGLRVRYPLADRASFRNLQDQLITSPTGKTVALSTLVNEEMAPEQTEIHRENLRNLDAVTAHLEGRDLGSAMKEIQRRLYKEVQLPPGTEIEFGGLYQIQQESFSGLTRVLLASMLLIFIILVFEFRSFSHPIAILIATVLCTSGSLLALFITQTTLNISSFMGIIMVIGIVHKNGILMLDSESHFTGKGYALRDAIFHAGRRRLRPILMTALATVCGMLPLAIGVGSGAQLLQPLAIAVIGGVVISMILSLVITPALFYSLRKKGL